jgi:hypothetical protein
MNNKLERLWIEAIICRVKAISRHLPGGTEENYKKPQPG